MLQRRSLDHRRGARRSVALYVVAPLLTLLAACSDQSPTAPTTALAPASVASFGKGGNRPSRVARPARGANAAQSLTFVYSPTKKTVQQFGQSDFVTIPAGAVCDPATSGYGVGLWDKPCTPLAKPITFTMSWTEDVYGHTVVEFSPDVRFVPGSQVVLDITDRVKPKDREKGTILWCPTGSAFCYDESVDDASTQTTARGDSFHLVRLLKHFSGYNVVFGVDGEVSGL